MRTREIRLAELRLDNNMNQEEIASKINVLKDTYSKWERGINDIPLQKINEIANYYNVCLDFLLDLTNKNYVTKRKSINLKLMSERLLLLRKENKLTQEQLGIKTGFHQRTYAHYENGTNIPTTFKLCCLAIYYGISMDYLVGRTDDKKGINKDY